MQLLSKLLSSKLDILCSDAALMMLSCVCMQAVQLGVSNFAQVSSREVCRSLDWGSVQPLCFKL